MESRAEWHLDLAIGDVRGRKEGKWKNVGKCCCLCVSFVQTVAKEASKVNLMSLFLAKLVNGTDFLLAIGVLEHLCSCACVHF